MKYVYHFRAYTSLYGKLMDAQNLATIVEITGCRKPCFYNEYKLILPTLTKYDMFTFAHNCTVGSWVASPETTVQTEVLLYPWTSLVAEFGGTLGLFMGFSFMSLWDGVNMALRTVKLIKEAYRTRKTLEY